MEHNERIDSSAGEPVLACKRRKHLRLAALAVCCALLGGIAGGAATGLLLQGRERAAMPGRPVSRRPYPGEKARARSLPRRVWPRLREN